MTLGSSSSSLLKLEHHHLPEKHAGHGDRDLAAARVAQLEPHGPDLVEAGELDRLAGSAGRRPSAFVPRRAGKSR